MINKNTSTFVFSAGVYFEFHLYLLLYSHLYLYFEFHLYLYLNFTCICICICILTCIGEVATVLCVALPACSEQQWKSHSLEVGEPRLWAPSAGWWSLTSTSILLWICSCCRDVEGEMVLDVIFDVNADDISDMDRT